ncbi:cytochrome ubiquinol oxidase subunit I [Glacieibacterium megasporae]|uniref:cytochrome ubiquinol oxidase subunit I n=1 Tax=Glacieibacterium megasporae TaxID=2835787 RepID=UPI001CAA4F60|nr:cytochrome ubiquinol oxidase subunit I [Polymorphobacter megasporae]UAJ12783.1 cytochrome ubiquinol oxidase subunit I [Polymorphobacter megasporae]
MFDNASAIDLARAQFAFTISFHFIFPALSIGLASYLAVLEALWLRTGREVYLTLFKYWLKIFAIAFGMGVVSGIVMAYQFGTNWAVFSDKAGPVIGPLMAYEVLTAFFLEAGFLGVMLFGMERVGRKLHFTATLAVAAGTFISAFWIIVVNSWMQTPQGYGVNAHGQFIPLDWWVVIFNPSMPYRLVHTVLGAYLTVAFVVGGVGAWHLLRERHHREGPSESTRVMFSMAMWMAAIVAPLQIVAGHTQGENTLAYQPAKIAAMEGDYRSYPHGAPLTLFGIPDQANGVMRHAVEIPLLGSLVLKNDLHAPIAGLDAFPRRDWAPVNIVFWTFRIMVAIGVGMAALGLWSLVARATGNLYGWPWMHRFAVLMGPTGFVAVIAGWATTESGRQPFTVFHLLRTAQSVSPLQAPAVASSLIAFVLVYFAVFGTGTWFILKLMGHSPHPGESGPSRGDVTRTAGITPAPQLDPSILSPAE